MQILDLILRSGAIGIAVLVVLQLIVSAAPRRKVAALLSLFGLAVCYVLVSSPNTLVLVTAVEPALVLGAILLPVAFTWAVLEILFDEVRDWWVWIAVAGVSVPAAFLIEIHVGFGVARGGVLLLLYLGLIYLAVTTRADDLVEKRRMFRRWFVVLMAVLGVAISVVEIGFSRVELPDLIFLLQGLGLFGLALAFGMWALEASDEMWPAAVVVQATVPTGAQDTLIVRKLETAIEAEMWRTEGMTIGRLADEIGVAEHKLRRVINGALGFRNFSAFLSHHRIKAARMALSDPEQAGRSILEIAYDSGFASLGPFNKAFRLETGQSPRQFRRDGQKS